MLQFVQHIGINLFLRSIFRSDVVGILLQCLKIGIIITIRMVRHISKDIGQPIVSIRDKDATDCNLRSISPAPLAVT